MDTTKANPDPGEDPSLGEGDELGGDIGLLDLAPVEVPDDIFDHALSVAVDPSTPPLDDGVVEELLPDEASLTERPEDIDLSDFDDPSLMGVDPEGGGLDAPVPDDLTDDAFTSDDLPESDSGDGSLLAPDHTIDHHGFAGSDDVSYTEHDPTGILDSDTGGTYDDTPSVDDV